MSRLLYAVLMALSLVAQAETTRESLIRRLDEAVVQNPYNVTEAFSFAAACGLRESRFFDPTRTVRPIRPEAEAWWLGLLFELSSQDDSVSCNREVLFGLLPRPWNPELVQLLRGHLHGAHGRAALELLAYAGLLGALDVTFTPDESFFMSYMDSALARMVAGENPLASNRYEPRIFNRSVSRLLEGAKAMEQGTAAVMPRASIPFSCAERL